MSSPAPASSTGPDEELPPSPERIAAVRDQFAASRGLTLGDAYPEGTTGWVGAATGPAGEDLVLKVGFAHEEARDEALGLRIWSEAAAGGAVPRVLEAFRDDDVSVILMERVVPGFTLAASDLTPEQEDEVVAALLQRLWIPVPVEVAPERPTVRSPERLRPLAHMCGWWADEAAQRLAMDSWGLPAEVIDGGLDLFRRLPLEYEGAPVLLATDFHHHNVLAATDHPTMSPEDWVAIDPKPYVGDPHYDLVQHMLNFPDRLATDPAGFAERMATLTGLAPERAVRWLFARCVQEAPASDLSGTAQAAITLAPRVLG
jgi:streptomycin 6-kinase